MSSDKRYTPGSITIVPLGTGFLHAPLISHELYLLLERSRPNQEKILLLYNRRGFGRTWICKSCGYFPLCRNCDIALAYHITPKKKLVCHQCGHSEALYDTCPACGERQFQSIGTGIQEVESHISQIFPSVKILRIDSDTGKKKEYLNTVLPHHDIILSTHAHISLIHSDIHTIVVLLFESDLILPDYRVEEDLYHILDYTKKIGKSLLIQTYIPEHPLLSIIANGNYKDFLAYMSKERERFGYPPYSDIALIYIHDEKKDKVIDVSIRLINKIQIIKTDDIFIGFDMNLLERRQGEWIQKITMKGKNLSPLIKELEVEILRNSSITLEWR